MMPIECHHDVRTTITLDEDVAARLKQEVRRSGAAFKQVVNDALRRGLTQNVVPKCQPFRVKARPLGLYPGLNYDCVSELLEQIEGPLHR